MHMKLRAILLAKHIILNTDILIHETREINKVEHLELEIPEHLTEKNAKKNTL